MSYQLTEQDINQADSISKDFCRTKLVQYDNYEDYLSVGRLGLVKASYDYIPQENATFQTYAHHRILGEVKDYARSSYVRHSKQPKAHTQAISLEQLRQETGWESSADGVEGRTINKDLCSKLLNMLKPREQRIFHAYYFQDLKMIDIAKILGCTESRVSQIIDKNLKKLRIKYYIMTHDETILEMIHSEARRRGYGGYRA